MINDRYYKRRFVITAIAIAVVVVYIIRLFVLQVVDSSTIDKAESNAVVRQTVYPPRGLIYDRNGELLVFNQPLYDVTMIMREQCDGFDAWLLSGHATDRRAIQRARDGNAQDTWL